MKVKPSNKSSVLPGLMSAYGILRYMKHAFSNLAIFFKMGLGMRVALADSSGSKQYCRYVSFVIPLGKDTPFHIDYMIVLLEFMKRFRGLCELIIIDNGVNEGLLKMIWLYIRLFRKSGSRVKVRFLRNTVDLGIVDSVKYGLNMSLGEKVIFILLDLKAKNGKNPKELLREIEVFSSAEVHFLSDFPSVSYLESLVSS